MLLNPPLDSELMPGDNFGPLLPIITLDDIKESIDFINTKAKPITIYAFNKDEKLKNIILSETSSGGVTFNDTIVQVIIASIQKIRLPQIFS
ncbi:Aldehyde dehydrogenase family 3 member F1 [Linum perenne]